MSVRQKLRSKAVGIFLGRGFRRLRGWRSEKWRQLNRQQHVVRVFLQLDDPYSYILSHYLPSFAVQYDIDLRVYLSKAIGDDFQPAPEMLAEYAINDCTRLALELGIPFLDKGSLPPSEFRSGMSDAVASAFGGDSFNDELLQALAIFWRGDVAAAAEVAAAATTSGVSKQIVNDSQQLLQKLGHYGSAMLHYGGEWYWGVDRLHYLTMRLDALGAANTDAPDALLASLRQAKKITLPIKPPTAARDLPPIELFTSFRSPYSYLSLQRTFDIADAFGMQVKLRPVLPMVMRGMQVPRTKMMYIANDAAREAERAGIAFGKIVDPLGEGVERCMAVFMYAESENKGRDFLLRAGNAIWAEGIDVATDKGLRKLTGRCGLFWPDVEKAVSNDDWRAKADSNRASMMNSGCWGVPTIRMGDVVMWGQDRDWMLVRHVEELCDTGDGILV